MNIQKQIKAGAKLLESKDVSPEHIAYFKAVAPELAQKAIGHLANHYHKLLKIAGAHNDATEDNKVIVNFSLGARLDLSDLDVYDLKLNISYSERFTDSAGAQGPVHEGDELPLTDEEESIEEAHAEDEAVPEDDPLAEGAPK